MSVSGSDSVQCREEERLALLHINASMSFPIHSLDGKWGGKECCQWERVTCHPISGHVTQLDLAIFDDDYYEWFDSHPRGISLNATLFLPLRQLRSLSLSGLRIYNCTDDAGFESWSNLTELQVLDLSDNELPQSIISSLSKVSSLRALYLDFNHLMGDRIYNVSVQELSALNLEVVSLRDCNLNGSSLNLGHWSSLKALSLAENYLNDTLSLEGIANDGVVELNYANFLLHSKNEVNLDGEELSNFVVEFISKGRLDSYLVSMLQIQCTIDLSSNNLVGNIPEDIGRMKRLITLNLLNNHLSSTIPNSISNLHQLESLDLSHNSLTGEIPLELTKLTSLEYFTVAYNNLSGPTLGMEVQFSTFANSSYEGNPNLCGPPLSKNCVSSLNTTQPSTNEMSDSRRDEGTDFLILFGSFSLFFVVNFWCFMVVLYFKRNWRYALFTLVDHYGDMIYGKVVLLARKIGAA